MLKFTLSKQMPPLLLTGAFMLCTSFALQAQTTPRSQQTINFGWHFHAGDIPEAVQPSYDDSKWESVNLPHDFQVSQPWVAPSSDEKADNTDVGANISSRLSSRAFKEMGKGWYRLHLTPADSLKGRRLLLDFEGIMYVGDVYLNGEKVGKTDYGYVGFEVDVTKKIKFGQDNVIAVMADTREPNNSRWYTGGGLFRDVHLISTDPQTYFTRHPLQIVTRNNNEVDIRFESAWMGTNPETQTVGVKITDPKGRVIYSQKESVERNRKMRVQELPLKPIALPNAMLWDCENPHLYKAELTLYREDGSEADVVSEYFGVRTVEFGPEYGLKINGKKVLLKGIANHHTLGALGAAAFPKAIEKRIKLLKDYGFNHIRTSHNPYSKSLLDLCDRYGILVVDELYDKWLDQYCGGRERWVNLWQQDIPEFIKRDRNHPSVILWSLGNELQTYNSLPFNDWGVTPYRLLRPLVMRYDSTRLVTVAMHPRGRDHKTDSLPAPLAKVTDIQAYNYRYMYFPGDGRRFPWMTFYQSEASIAAMGPNFFEMDLDRVIGLAYWGAIDYLGESHGWPEKGWAQGVFDISLEPKPKAFLLKSMFSNEPVVHIAVIDSKKSTMWNGIQTANDGMSDHWNRDEGSMLRILTYTNADEVELFVNGKSLGVKKNNRQNAKVRNQIEWTDVEYHAGNAEAVARTAGKVVARHKIVTTQEAKKLILKAEDASWVADGNDLMHVRVNAIDAKGNKAVTAQDELTFEIMSGDAAIAAVSNGNHSSHESLVGNKRKLHNGSALVILRAGQKAGKVQLRVSAKGFKPTTMTFETK